MEEEEDLDNFFDLGLSATGKWKQGFQGNGASADEFGGNQAHRPDLRIGYGQRLLCQVCGADGFPGVNCSDRGRSRTGVAGREKEEGGRVVMRSIRVTGKGLNRVPISCII